MESVSLNTYAKINLSLDVTGVREDGYHEVSMVMHAIGLHDDLQVRLFDAQEFGVTIKTNLHYVPTDQRNTAYKAAVWMIDRYLRGVHSPAEIRIDIRKEIPVSAGLAGGSSNAAGVILAIDRLYGLHLSLSELCDAGAAIGADVPFCIMSIAATPEWYMEGASPCALATGTGTSLEPLPGIHMWVVLAKPPFSVSTADVYRDFDRLESVEHPDTASMLRGLHTGNLPELRRGMTNVLENVTMTSRPAVRELKVKMQRYCPDMTLMSGSGPTVYSLFTNRKKADAAYHALKSQYSGSQTRLFQAKTLG